MVVGLALQLTGFPILLLGGMVAPRGKCILCTSDNLTAHLCSEYEHQALIYGSVLLAIGAIVFLAGLYLDKTVRA